MHSRLVIEGGGLQRQGNDRDMSWKAHRKFL